MKGYCTKCKINWSRLHHINDESLDAEYYSCWICHSDAHIVDVLPGDTFIYDLIRGVSDHNGVPIPVVHELPPFPKKSAIELANWKAWGERFERNY